MTYGVQKIKKETFTIIVKIVNSMCARKQSIEECVYLLGLTHRLFVQSPGLTYCLFVQSSPNVQVSWPSSLLQHLIAKLGNKCLNVHVSKCLALCSFCKTRSPKWAKKTSVAWNYFLFSFLLIVIILIMMEGVYFNPQSSLLGVLSA